jgi:phosphatidate cytidylyltransferase
MIRGVVFFTLVAYAIGAAGLVLASLRVDASTRRARLIKLATYFLIVQGVLFAGYLGRTALLAVAGVVSLAGGWEVARALRSARMNVPARVAAFAAFVALALSLIGFVATRPPSHVVFAYVIVAVFDGFAQVTGQLIGRRRLAPTISPSKTVEGVVGGALAALIAAYWVRELAHLTAASALATSGALLVAALAGDLAASAIKRRAGLKDYSRLLPGHGGVLDRFDSLLGSAPIAWLLL